MIRNRQKGYTVLETVFYIALFAALSLAVINALILMARSFRETSLEAEYLNGANIMEKVSREIRRANGATVVSASDLSLATTDSSGAAKTEEFLLTGSDLQFKENGTLTGNLNEEDVSLTVLSFSKIETAKGSAVKINFTIKLNSDPGGRTESFYDTVVLRGNYTS